MFYSNMTCCLGLLQATPRCSHKLTSTSMRLNSSKQAQAPEHAKPLKNLPCTQCSCVKGITIECWTLTQVEWSRRVNCVLLYTLWCAAVHTLVCCKIKSFVAHMMAPRQLSQYVMT